MTLYHDDGLVQLHLGDALDVARELPAGIARTIVTSPPYYGLRDYGHEGQLGAEATLAEYVDHLVELFAELRRVLADDGTVWLNLGDSYAGRANAGAGYTGNHGRFGRPGHVPYRKSTTGEAPYKNLLGIPWRVAFGMQDDGWILRSDVVWAKPNPMPESISDRPTRSHEFVFLFAKRPRYFYDGDAIREQDSGAPSGNGFDRSERISGHLAEGDPERWQPGRGRNRRDVWTVGARPFPEAHFATFPPDLVRPCIRAGSAVGDLVLDPFSGSGTTGLVATSEGRRYLGIDIQRDYLDLSLRTRFAQPPLQLEEPTEIAAPVKPTGGGR